MVLTLHCTNNKQKAENYIHRRERESMKVVVTGASGYLGGRLCNALLQQGHHVRALVRPTSDLSGLPPPSSLGADGAALEIVYGDVTDYPSLLSAFFDCHVIFHAAALVEPWLPDPSKFFSVSTSPYYSPQKSHL